MLQSALSNNQKLKVETIRECAETVVSLRNDILDISKVEAGHLEIDIQKFDLREMIAHTERLWRTRSDAKNLELSVAVETDVPNEMEGDTNRIKQVLFNLLSNTIKYRDQGKVMVNVRSKGLEDGSHRIRFVVQDTGGGLDVETQERLFQRYIQPSPSIGEPEGGAGLGIAIGRNLVEMMGGTMGVDSEIGVGSFYFELPLGVPKKASTNSLESAEIESFKTDPNVSVLIVEDNQINQRVLEAFLAPFQFESKAATNGAKAVELVKQDRFDIILMDIQMPIMDGIDATRKIRELGGWCETVPIVAVTENAMAGDREKYMEAGMDDYVPTPVNRETLTEVLNKYKLGSGDFN